MTTPACSTNVDSQLFQVYYYRNDAIVHSTGTFTHAFLASTLASLKNAGLTPIAVTSSGPNGNYTYAASGFDGYLSRFGGGKPWPGSFGGPPGGIVDDNGNLICPPPPGDGGAGGGPTCPPGYTFDPVSELCVPDGLGGGFGGGGGGGGGSAGGGGGTPPPVQCTVPGNVPMVNGACPIGYVADPNDEGCCRPIIAAVPPGPLPQPPPPGDGDDELGECCQLTATYLYYIALALQNLKPSGDGGSSACCAQVVGAIAGVSSALGAIAKELPGLAAGGPPPDFSAVTTELKCICDQLAAIKDAKPLDLTPVVNAIDRLREALPKEATDPNVKRIADVVNDSPPDAPGAAERTRSLLQLAVDKYGFPADAAQVLTT